MIEDKGRVKQVIDQAKNILVVIGDNPNVDVVASALGLYLSLAKNRTVTIASPTPALVEHSSLVGIDKVVSELGPRKFIITLNDVLGSVEKVTHYLEDDKLNVVVHPLPNSKGFSSGQVQFSQTEPDFDLIITVGVSELRQLGKLYAQEQGLYSNTKIISILAGEPKQDFASFALNSPSAASTSEITALFLKDFGLPYDEDIASNLYQGLEFATDHFVLEKTTPETFEAAAICARFKLKMISRVAANVAENAIMQNNQGPKPPLTAEDYQTATVVGQEEVQPEPDWFEPKIFKSSQSDQK